MFRSELSVYLIGFKVNGPYGETDKQPCIKLRGNHSDYWTMTDQFHADELPTSAGIDKLDKLRFRDFLHDVYDLEYPESEADRLRLLQNMNLATLDGFLNLASVLLFAPHPQWIKPPFIIKGIRYYGDAIPTDDELDTEDFTGPLRKVFEDALAFILRNLHKIQAGCGVNDPGLSEVPRVVFEALRVNALIHRDSLSAPRSGCLCWTAASRSSAPVICPTT